MKNLSIIGTIISTLALSGCQTTNSSQPKSQLKPITTQVQLTAPQRATIEAAIRQQLKDPESARFGTMVAGSDGDEGGITVCGTVNAKNSFGGYTGDAPFTGVLVESGFVVIGLSNNPTSASATLMVCQQKGLLL